MGAALGLLGVGAAAMLYVLFAASSKPAPEGIARLARGELTRLEVLEAPPPLPNQRLTDAEGATQTLAELQGGEVLVLNLWATWCAPCLEEMPTLGALQRAYEGRGVRVLAVSVDSAGESAKAETELARLSDYTLPFLIEPSRAILFAAQARGMPTTIVYDREGQEIARLSGGADWSGPEAIALIDAALAQ